MATIIPTTTDPTKTSVQQVFVFVRTGPEPDTKDQLTGPGVAYYVGHDGIVRRPAAKEVGTDEPLPPALIGNYWAPDIGADVPVAMRALAARDAALNGADVAVDQFASEILGLWRGGRWRESVSTALLGDWADPLAQDGGCLAPAFLGALKAEARTVHRQLTPIWRREREGHRLWSLDRIVGDGLGLTTYDLVNGGPDPYEVLIGTLPDNPRIAAVLARLTPLQRAVTLARFHWNVTSWPEAAAEVIALAPHLSAGLSPEALGDSVRRKLHRLGEEHKQRADAAAETRERG
ncbi:hypothetical protein ACFWZ2_43450 [Streptomyces sp. NPDC059002]|uniref:hypothetical protein n=1 Tax=Streptomyces sp. NPDC059002 TaxID=3346690 RepID=UPI0036BD0853